MEKTVKILRCIFCVLLISMVLLVGVLFLLKITVLSKDTSIFYYPISAFAVLFTMVSAYVALKMYRFPIIRRYLYTKNADSQIITKRYQVSYVVRMLLLNLSFEINVLIYFLYADTSHAFCALISVLGFLFLWPSIDRMMQEVNEGNKNRLMSII